MLKNIILINAKIINIANNLSFHYNQLIIGFGI